MLLITILVTPFVFGADIFGKAFAPLKGLPEVYQKYDTIIDAILYFALFISVAKTAFGEKFKESNVPTIMGVILAIGMIMFEYSSKFRLGTIIIPIAIIVAILGIYKWIKKTTA
jgi:hypothetical protein